MSNSLAVFFNVIKFGFSVFIIYYIPGSLLITMVLKKKFNPWEKTILSFSIGIIVIPQVYYLLENIKLHNFFLALVIVAGLIYFVYKWIALATFKRAKKWFKFKLKLSREKLLLLAIIVSILVIASLVIGTSGIIYSNGMRFYDPNSFDSMNQLTMVQELAKDPPHEFPFYSDLSLKGYHVGSFYWRAIVQKVTKIDSIDLFFRFCPLFLLPLIVAMVFVSIRNLTGSSNTGLMAIFFIFLMGDLSWTFRVLDRLLPFIEIPTVGFRGNLLYSFMFNPPIAHGALIFFMGCYFLRHSYVEKDYRRLWPILLFSGFLFGFLFEYKAFMWAVVLLALILTATKEYFFNKKSIFLAISLYTIAFSILSFFRGVSTNQTFSLFKLNVGYYPLSVFRQMGILGPETKTNFLIILLASLFYLIGTLGVKILGFSKIYRQLKDWKKTPQVFLFLIFSMIVSFIFTHTLLLKSIYFYATYSFFVIFLLAICIFAAEALISWTKRQKFLPNLCVCLILIFMSIVSTVYTFAGLLPKYSRYKLISKNVLEAADYIKKNSEQDAVILHNVPAVDWIYQNGHKKQRDIMQGRDCFISALAARRTVLECAWYVRSIGSYAYDLEKRQNNINLFFQTKDRKAALKILRDYAVSYLWLQDNQKIKFNSKGLLKEVFSSGAIKIYEICLPIT